MFSSRLDGRMRCGTLRIRHPVSFGQFSVPFVAEGLHDKGYQPLLWARCSCFSQRVEKPQWLIAQIIREHLLK